MKVKTKKSIAKEALDEAKKRQLDKPQVDLPTEIGGRDDLEPTRYGDWEKKGITSDF